MWAGEIRRARETAVQEKDIPSQSVMNARDVATIIHSAAVSLFECAAVLVWSMAGPLCTLGAAEARQPLFERSAR